MFSFIALDILFILSKLPSLKGPECKVRAKLKKKLPQTEKMPLVGNYETLEPPPEALFTFF